MNYKKIDRDFAYKRMYDLIKKECPDKTEEFYKLVAEQRVEDGIRFWLKEYISDKLQKIGFYDQGQADRKANRIMKNLPK